MSALAEPTTIEIRSGNGYQIADVDFPKRIVTCIAMPYEQPTLVEYGDRIVTEIVSRGAFAGIEKRTNKIKANRDHNWDRPVGKIVALHPSRQEGLVTEVRMAPTPLGEETLTLCDEDVLAASAGFALLRRSDGRIWDDAEVWERSRTLRRLNRILLDHLAFVPNPAYEGAAVISIRNASVPGREPQGETPNRDHLVTEELRKRMAELDARFPH